MDVFKRISELLEGGESFALAVIVSRSGSAPRNVGARMVVRKDGSIVGTIGGGILEATVMDIAKTVFIDKMPVFRKFVFTAEDAERIGMICGGEVEVLVHFVEYSKPSDVRFYQEILATIRSRKRGWIITELPSTTDAGEAPVQHLVRGGTTVAGSMDDGTLRTLTAQVGASQAKVAAHGDRRFLVESLCSEGTVYIFGAGHVSQKLATLTGFAGFQTVVLDDRQEFANRELFATADQIVVLDSFARAMEGLEINEDSYLVLVTRGHMHDKTVLGQALRTRAGYIGMIGSRKKRDAVYEELSVEGFPRHEFGRVYSPIGLDIGAETPEEIAVSIVAELIRARAGRSR
jgi:xanthine dehydrogenase accessory factor